MASAQEQLAVIMEELPPDLQQEVVDFAHYLAERRARGAADQRPRFYICPVCFQAATERLVCHDHLMIPCNAEKPEDCKPFLFEDGHVKSRAPRWFVTAVARQND